MKSPIALLLFLLLAAGVFGCGPSPEPVAPTRPTAVPTASPLALLSEATASPPPGDATCAPGQVVATTAMTRDRAAHSATLLPDGTVLLAGGFSGGEQATDSAEIFDPATRTFTAIAPMTVARQSHSATPLPDGKVLLAGGFNGEYLASAELFDPSSRTFTPVAPMTTGRSGHQATPLPDGRLLMSGGTGPGWSFLASAELYDPARGTFEATGSMAVARESHTATRLGDGTVLVTGGHEGRRAAITIYDSAERYDPQSGTFLPTGPMTVRRHKHDATLLADGRIMISGGADERDAAGAYESTEIYDPARGTFAPAGRMLAARYKHTGTSLRLPDGRVLLVGGAGTTELYDPRLDRSMKVANGVGVTRLFATATLLPTGEILFAGGYGSDIAAGGQAWLLESCHATGGG